MTIKQYKIGMTCRKHGLCDLVNVQEGVGICSAPHHYEVYNSLHHYDQVFYTVSPKEYIDIEEKQ